MRGDAERVILIEFFLSVFLEEGGMGWDGMKGVFS